VPGNIDLHCHSSASDGTLAPTDVVRLAVRRGLSALSLTDHDTIAGLPDAAEEAARQNLDFLPGIEISAEFGPPGTMHLLGYGVDIKSPVLLDLTRRLLDARNDRNPRIIRRLNEMGIPITMQQVADEAGGDVLGRPHIAAVLLKTGHVQSMKQAFDVYLGQGGSAYFDKERIPASEAIDLIRRSGGLTVLAHAFQLRTENDAQLERIVKDLTDLGLAGIEVYHSDHNDAWIAKCSALADRFGLLKTGGSDFHGTNKKNIDLGIAHGHAVPREFYDRLVARLDSAGAASAKAVPSR
jgi:hypothetical protein